jgi:pimeloyl-ACP methyl ester carboxylesterase
VSRIYVHSAAMARRAARPLLLLLSLATGAGAQPALTWEAHRLRTYDGTEHEVQLGRLEVPESRSAPTSPSISVAMLRLATTNPRPGSPIIFLMGGPGVPASVMAQIPPYWALFDSLRSVADVILLDQRGLGLSTPNLDCPAGTSPAPTFMTSRAAFVAEYKRIITRCSAHFLSRGSSARTLTDGAIADDIEALRVALRVPRVSLLGFSYGTRLALTYARRHPDGVDRLVLQGPTDADLMYRAAGWHDSLFRMIARESARDPVSAPFSQDLIARTAALLERVDREPIPVPLGTTTGDSITIPVGRELLAGTITGRISDPRIPALIATLEVDDVSVLRLFVTSVFQDMTSGTGSLMARAVTCSQPPGSNRTVAVDVTDAQTFFGPLLDNFVSDLDFCLAVWGGPFKPEPIRSKRVNRPVLFIVGSRDDRTPPYNARLLAADLRTVATLLVEEGGHELLPLPEVQREVVRYFRTGELGRTSLRVPAPRYLSIEDARRPPRRPGS